jgi:hypothetical protein
METHLLIVLILLAIVIYLFNRYSITEPFTSYDGIIGKLLGGGKGTPDYENAHGSEPAGYLASPGLPQQMLNEGARHVDPMYRGGNPQNTYKEYKRQPQ